MNLTIANLSTISDAALASTLAAITTQITRDFVPEWHAPALLGSTRLDAGFGQASIDGAPDAIIYLGTAVQDPTTGAAGLTGYHSTNFSNMPYGFVYLDVCAAYQEDWTCTLSHEVLELLADPAAMLTVTAPDPRSTAQPPPPIGFDLEVCDPVQGDSYKIADVTVSNFVTRAYFGMPGGAAATNFLQLPLQPFGVRPGGYLQYTDAAGAHEIDGDRVDAGRRLGRAMLGGYRRTSRRALRLGLTL
jgi:hypothetical protein